MAVERAPEIVAAPVVEKRPATGGRKWLAVGTGVALEADGADLRALVAKVRPGGVSVLGAHRIAGYAERPAAEWGADLLAFLKSLGMARGPVWLVLPRRDVIVRQLSLPGVERKDLEAAVAFQIDSLHPYPDDTVAFAWARLPGSPVVLVGIARHETVDHWSNLLAEAGIPIAGFTFSAAALYSAARILVRPPDAFLAWGMDGDAVEAYGESGTRPVFSGVFDQEAAGRGLRLARSELRLDDTAPELKLSDLLPVPLKTPADFSLDTSARLLAAATMAACPRLSLPANLLPVERRSQTSRLLFVPTAILGLLLAAAAVTLSLQPSHEDKQYLLRLNTEIRDLQRQAAEASTLDTAAAKAQERIALLDRHRQRSQADADALRELTKLLVPPAWLNVLLIARTEVQMTGEAEQAAPLLKILDESPVFRDSSFAQAMTKIGGAESFIIRSAREGQGTGLEAGEQR